MARTLKEIQAEIFDAIEAEPVLAEANSTSATAIWRLWVYVVSIASRLTERLFDRHADRTAKQLANDKRLLPGWYVQKALEFQLGSTLVEGTDYYDNTGLTVDQIAARKIIKYSAFSEGGGIATIKVAKLTGGELAPLDSGTEYPAAAAYMADIKGAGVSLQLISMPADKLKLEVQIEYNPQLLGLNGESLAVGGFPVSEAINNWLKSVEFGGILRLDKLTDVIQAVPGVVQPTIMRCQVAKSDVNAFTDIYDKYVPYAGYVRFAEPADLAIIYVV